MVTCVVFARKLARLFLMRIVFYLALMACGSSQPAPRQVPVPAKAPAATIDDEPVFSQSDWKHWIDEDGDCQNTRQEVLIAESEIPVVFKTNRKCEVASGKWTCPFTGKVFNTPSDLAITHLVPLVIADNAGGHSWTQARRQDYANELTTEFHLIAVQRAAKDKRSERSPTAWLPEKNVCSYIQNWIEIALQWNLKIDTEIFALHTSRCLSDNVAFGCPESFHNRPNCSDFSDLVGTWSGRGSQSIGSSWDVKVTISGPSDTRCATVDYDKGSCGGYWTCKQDRQGRSFAARETLTYGKGQCVDDLEVVTTLNNKNQLVIKWKMTGETAEATLVRTAPNAQP